MSLNWSVKNVNDDPPWISIKGRQQHMGNVQYGEEGSDGEYINPITDGFIWMTMTLGFHQISIANVDEVFLRIRAWERVTGAWFSKPQSKSAAIKAGVIRPDTFDKDGFITFAEVKRHIGLSTNASSISAHEFKMKLAKEVLGEAMKDLKREKLSVAQPPKT